MSAEAPSVLNPEILGKGVAVTQRPLDRFALAHDASHYLLVPNAVVTPETAMDVGRIFRASHASSSPITFRSGGTSLSGQGISGSILVDTRKRFQNIVVTDEGLSVRVRAANQRSARPARPQAGTGSRQRDRLHHRRCRGQ